MSPHLVNDDEAACLNCISQNAMAIAGRRLAVPCADSAAAGCMGDPAVGKSRLSGRRVRQKEQEGKRSRRLSQLITRA